MQTSFEYRKSDAFIAKYVYLNIKHRFSLTYNLFKFYPMLTSISVLNIFLKRIIKNSVNATLKNP